MTNQQSDTRLIESRGGNKRAKIRVYSKRCSEIN